MAIFTVEATYRLPIFRHTTYVARDVNHACRQAIADEDWQHQKKDYESSGSTYITGVWRGADAAYVSPAEAVPLEFAGEDGIVLSTHQLLATLNAAIEAWPQFDSDDEVPGADLVDWFGQWRSTAKSVAQAAQRHLAPNSDIIR